MEGTEQEQEGHVEQADDHEEGGSLLNPPPLRCVLSENDMPCAADEPVELTEQEQQAVGAGARYKVFDRCKLHYMGLPCRVAQQGGTSLIAINEPGSHRCKRCSHFYHIICTGMIVL